MALKILLNYRRGDTAGNAGRLYAALAERFGEENVFMDIDKIDPGLNFVDVINDWVGRCDVFIAMIGTQWLDSAYKSGQRRLDDPNDFVRMEIESALERPDVRLIPVLVQDVDMPSADELPQSMRALALRNGIEIRDVSWDYDVGRLIQAIERIGRPDDGDGGGEDDGGRRPRLDPKRIAIVAGALLVVLALAAAALALADGDEENRANDGTGTNGSTVAEPGTEQLVYAGVGDLFAAPLGVDEDPVTLAGDGVGQPDTSRTGSRIAVERGGDIVVLDAAGRELQALTSGDDSDDAPSWAPNGRRVAFNRKDADDDTIAVFVVDLRGRVQPLMPEAGRTGAQPDWSPDGRRIAFQRKGSLFVMAASGVSSSEELLVRSSDRGQVHEPAWSPDGQEIALWIDEGDGPDIYVYSLADGSLDNVTDGEADSPTFPSWSPDGTRIAFADVDGIWTITRQGDDLTQVVDDEGLESPTWRRARTTTG
jgi:Tol biopolymer transport system component